MKNLSESLKAKNLKATHQRLVIYNYLKENQNHPSAETIYNNIKKMYPTISLSTVYKTLNSLKDADLIREINVGEDSFRYDIKMEPHSHMICNECNCILDYFFEDTIMSQLNQKIMEDTSFSILNQQLFFYGICEECLNK